MWQNERKKHTRQTKQYTHQLHHGENKGQKGEILLEAIDKESFW